MITPRRWLDAVLRERTPLSPLPTGISPELQPISGIKAVVFDIYGTLVISGSGDIGTAGTVTPSVADSAGVNQVESSRAEIDAELCHLEFAMEASLSSVGWQGSVGQKPTAAALQAEIRAMNSAAGAAEGMRAEVDIFSAWRRMLHAHGLADLAADTQRIVRLAAEYEARANPTWPMPGARELLAFLQRRSAVMGVVSNAQAFTELLIEDLAGGDLQTFGFDLNLCIYSYRFRRAKPSSSLFAFLIRGLSRRGIAPQRTLYVGNDMLNDIWAASQFGLKTAWFAGDARSCRPRLEDIRCSTVRPDLVLTELNQLASCLE